MIDVSAGLTIEHSPRGTLLLKVSCRDRPGLLSDVLNTLKAVPVVIVGANATTADDGMAHDTFEVGHAVSKELVCAALGRGKWVRGWLPEASSVPQTCNNVR